MKNERVILMEEKQLEIIVGNITKLNDGLEEAFAKKLLSRLDCFGYKVTESDDWCLSFSINKIINHIKNVCNIKTIPKELEELVIDKIVGELFFSKKQSNQLDLDSMKFDIAVKSLQMGDASISFATGEGSSTDEDKLNALINYLINKGEKDLICFRKLRW